MMHHLPQLRVVQACEECAKLVANAVEVPERQLQGSGPGSTRSALCEELKRLPGKGNPKLHAVMLKGVAFHHAGAG